MIDKCAVTYSSRDNRRIAGVLAAASRLARFGRAAGGEGRQCCCCCGWGSRFFALIRA